MSQMIRLVCVGVNLDTVWQQRGALSLIMPSTGHIFPYEFAMHLKQKQPCKEFCLLENPADLVNLTSFSPLVFGVSPLAMFPPISVLTRAA